MLSHVSVITEVQSFCVHLGLETVECIKIKQYDSPNDQLITMLEKWQALKKKDMETWKEFIHPFVMLRECVKAKELAKEYSVYFDDKRNATILINMMNFNYAKINSNP